MTTRTRTFLAAIALLAASASPCLALISILFEAGKLRDTGGTPIENTPTLWAIVYDENDDGQLPGGLATDDSLVSGDAAAAGSAFAGKTIADGTIVDGDRIIAIGEFDSSFAYFAETLDYDLVADGLTPGRPYGLYWFPGRTLATNTLPASGSFDIGGINEITNYGGTDPATIPADGASPNTAFTDVDIFGPLPTSRLNAITATASTANFANWIAGFPAVGAEDGFEDDPDGDGLDNGVESALGTRPDTANPGITVLPGTADLTVQSSQAKPTLSDVDAEWKWSDNMTTWYSSGASNGSATVTISESVTDSSDPDFDVTKVEATVAPPGSLDKLFLRLSVTQNP